VRPTAQDAYVSMKVSNENSFTANATSPASLIEGFWPRKPIPLELGDGREPPSARAALVVVGAIDALDQRSDSVGRSGRPERDVAVVVDRQALEAEGVEAVLEAVRHLGEAVFSGAAGVIVVGTAGRGDGKAEREGGEKGAGAARRGIHVDVLRKGCRVRAQEPCPCRAPWLPGMSHRSDRRGLRGRKSPYACRKGP
jgi:hypothetical protein